MAHYLHNLGVIAYYYKYDILKDFIILNSTWSTDAVYRIKAFLEDHSEKNGIFSRTDFLEVLGNIKRYPRESLLYLINLFITFHIILPIASERAGNEYLMIERVNINPENPSGQVKSAWMLAKGVMSFRYYYTKLIDTDYEKLKVASKKEPLSLILESDEFIPSSMIYRLIASIYDRLDVTKKGARLFWRKGCYLRYKSAQAKVELYGSPGVGEGVGEYIDIRVIGEIPRERQQLLMIIRDRLDSINTFFASEVDIKEKVPCNCSPKCTNLFDYQILLNLEKNRVLKYPCGLSAIEVQISSLLDGVETTNDNQYVYTDKKDFLCYAKRLAKAVLGFIDFVENHWKFFSFLAMVLLIILGYFKFDDVLKSIFPSIQSSNITH